MKLIRPQTWIFNGCLNVKVGGKFLFVTSPDSIVLTIWWLEQLKRGLIWEEHPSPLINAPGLSLPAELHPVGRLDCGQLRLELGVWKAKPSKIDAYACVLSRERLCDLLRSIWLPICRSIGHFWSNFWRWWFLLPSKVSASFLDQEFWVSSCPVWCFFHHLFKVWMDTPIPLATSDWVLLPSSWATALHRVKQVDSFTIATLKSLVNQDTNKAACGRCTTTHTNRYKRSLAEAKPLPRFHRCQSH